ncbi:MAG: TIGR00730 family Rossman fold protein [Pikeienuella sp.]
MPAIKSLCLYCGSRNGTDPAHRAAAKRFGRAVAASGLRLVYGAGDYGLMGEAARAAQSAGAHVTGFIPRRLVDREVARTECDALVVTETMHERKALMLGNADAVVALSGGPGTLDELIEVLTWRNLGLHEKPVVLVNIAGYWDPLLALFRAMEAGGFSDARFLAALTVVDSPEAAIAALTDTPARTD